MVLEKISEDRYCTMGCYCKIGVQIKLAKLDMELMVVRNDWYMNERISMLTEDHPHDSQILQAHHPLEFPGHNQEASHHC